METETVSFCVVCVAKQTVIHAASWEIPESQRVDAFASAVATAAEHFGTNDFEVRIVDIRA